jgi:hypothetical protein
MALAEVSAILPASKYFFAETSQIHVQPQAFWNDFASHYLVGELVLFACWLIIIIIVSFDLLDQFHNSFELGSGNDRLFEIFIIQFNEVFNAINSKFSKVPFISRRLFLTKKASNESGSISTVLTHTVLLRFTMCTPESSCFFSSILFSSDAAFDMAMSGTC